MHDWTGFCLGVVAGLLAGFVIAWYWGKWAFQAGYDEAVDDVVRRFSRRQRRRDD